MKPGNHALLDLMEHHAVLARAKAGELTTDEAIHVAVTRLADLYEVLNGTRPTGAGLDEPEHVTLVRWMPILADYRMFAQRANAAQDRLRDAERERDEARDKVRDAVFRAGRAGKTLKDAQQALQAALDAVKREPEP